MTTPIDPTTLLGPTSAAAGTSTTGAGKSQTQLDKNTFLKLLIAQLQNQDPANPMDSTAYMSQMAQFSQVEALESIKSDLESQNSYYQSTVATSMLNKNVQVTPDQGKTYTTGVVDAVRFTSNGPILTVAGQDYLLSEVSAVATSGTTITKVPTPSTNPTTPTTPAAG